MYVGIPRMYACTCSQRGVLYASVCVGRNLMRAVLQFIIDPGPNPNLLYLHSSVFNLQGGLCTYCFIGTPSVQLDIISRQQLAQSLDFLPHCFISVHPLLLRCCRKGLQCSCLVFFKHTIIKFYMRGGPFWRNPATSRLKYADDLNVNC